MGLETRGDSEKRACPGRSLKSPAAPLPPGSSISIPSPSSRRCCSSPSSSLDCNRDKALAHCKPTRDSSSPKQLAPLNLRTSGSPATPCFIPLACFYLSCRVRSSPRATASQSRPLAKLDMGQAQNKISKAQNSADQEVRRRSSSSGTRGVGEHDSGPRLTPVPRRLARDQQQLPRVFLKKSGKSSAHISADHTPNATEQVSESQHGPDSPPISLSAETLPTRAPTPGASSIAGKSSSPKKVEDPRPVGEISNRVGALMPQSDDAVGDGGSGGMASSTTDSAQLLDTAGRESGRNPAGKQNAETAASAAGTSAGASSSGGGNEPPASGGGMAGLPVSDGGGGRASGTGDHGRHGLYSFATSTVKASAASPSAHTHAGEPGHTCPSCAGRGPPPKIPVATPSSTFAADFAKGSFTKLSHPSGIGLGVSGSGIAGVGAARDDQAATQMFQKHQTSTFFSASSAAQPWTFAMFQNGSTPSTPSLNQNSGTFSVPPTFISTPTFSTTATSFPPPPTFSAVPSISNASLLSNATTPNSAAAPPAGPSPLAFFAGHLPGTAGTLGKRMCIEQESIRGARSYHVYATTFARSSLGAISFFGAGGSVSSVTVPPGNVPASAPIAIHRTAFATPKSPVPPTPTWLPGSSIMSSRMRQMSGTYGSPPGPGADLGSSSVHKPIKPLPKKKVRRPDMPLSMSASSVSVPLSPAGSLTASFDNDESTSDDSSESGSPSYANSGSGKKPKNGNNKKKKRTTPGSGSGGSAGSLSSMYGMYTSSDPDLLFGLGNSTAGGAGQALGGASTSYAGNLLRPTASNPPELTFQFGDSPRDEFLGAASGSSGADGTPPAFGAGAGHASGTGAAAASAGM
ncbi:hypothetical protein BDK51DRAFT_48503, partial [Blyttiomyces helicus]